MRISELIEQLQQQQKLYGNYEIKVRSHKTGQVYPIDYVTLWTKTNEYYIGIDNKLSKKE
ncbi:hypothetical protein LJC28_03125 [Dysgonomonas sp. OttesenSCG-928-D17]|nr:hypothetical protein [Dysgonomonas sp. OttesenSCG-928-D17]